MYAHRARLGPVDIAFTDRWGGVSRPPFDQLNLALVGDDDPHARSENLRLVVADFAPGAGVHEMAQVHGADVVTSERSSSSPSTCDGLVTDCPDVVLVVRVADCVPVLLADPVAGVVAAAHAGRAGLVEGILPATVAAMRQRGAERVTAWVGPHVCASCYEVPDAMREEVAALVPQTWATTSWGTPALDLGAGVRVQLGQLDVEVDPDGGACTRESRDLYSHRRDGRSAGRSAGLVRLRGDRAGRREPVGAA